MLTEQEKKNAFGRRAVDIYTDAVKARNRHEDIEKMLQERSMVFNKMVEEELRPVPGSIELVKWARDNGFMVALGTSSPLEKMKSETRKLGIGGLFSLKVNGDMVKRGKPFPDIFLLTAKKLGLKPEECAVVEDSENGVKAAKAAGMFTIGFNSPHSPNQDRSMADAVVNDLEEVREHLR
jgi:HAD superfamily hydrolase (TIGR01509 family)